MKDNFSRQADIYAKYRPRYPQELFDFILEHTNKRDTAWDCATGNGQSAEVLARHFERVFATDISQKQIDNARQVGNIFYSVQPSEKTNFADNTFDLITVSQALHWFATEEFYKEVKRIAKAKAVFSAWSYSLLHIIPEIDSLIRHYYKIIVGPYWDAERRYVDEEYKTILFPFSEISSPSFTMEYYWTVEELEGYLNTWSALQEFITANEFSPVPDLMKKITLLWTGDKMRVEFPLFLRIGLIEK